MMRETFAVLFLISFLIVLAVPTITLGQAIPNIPSDCILNYDFDPPFAGCNPGTVTESNENWGMCCLLNTIYRAADLVFSILIAFAILMILLAAYNFMTAGGSLDRVNKARDYITYALIGLGVAFLAKAIPAIVKMLL